MTGAPVDNVAANCYASVTLMEYSNENGCNHLLLSLKPSSSIEIIQPHLRTMKYLAGGCSLPSTGEGFDNAHHVAHTHIGAAWSIEIGQWRGQLPVIAVISVTPNDSQVLIYVEPLDWQQFPKM